MYVYSSKQVKTVSLWLQQWICVLTQSNSPLTLTSFTIPAQAKHPQTNRLPEWYDLVWGVFCERIMILWALLWDFIPIIHISALYLYRYYNIEQFNIPQHARADDKQLYISVTCQSMTRVHHKYLVNMSKIIYEVTISMENILFILLLHFIHLCSSTYSKVLWNTVCAS